MAHKEVLTEPVMYTFSENAAISLQHHATEILNYADLLALHLGNDKKAGPKITLRRLIEAAENLQRLLPKPYVG